MIFQLIGRFFFGAKIFLKTKKNKPLPFARDPIPPGDPTRGRPFPERATSCQAIAIKLWIPHGEVEFFSNWQSHLNSNHVMIWAL